MPKIHQSTAGEAEIEAGLRKIRFRRRLSHGPFVTAFLLAGLMLLLKLVNSEASSAIARTTIFQFLSQALIAVGAILILFVPVAGLRCPRCRNLFHCGNNHRNDFTRKCLNCGLRLDGSNANESP